MLIHSLGRFLLPFIATPFLIYCLYVMRIHSFLFHTLALLGSLQTKERAIVTRRLRKEIVINMITPAIMYIGAVLSDKWFHLSMSTTICAWITLVGMILVFPNSFQTHRRGIEIGRIEVVAIHLYLVIAVFVTAITGLLLDYIFLRFVPLAMKHVDLKSSYEIPFSKPFTLSTLLSRQLPEPVFIFILIYAANVCCSFWFRALYYGLYRKFWPSVGFREYIETIDSFNAN